MRSWIAGSLKLVSALAVLLWAVSAGAEIYRWTDEEGNVHFGDKPLDPSAADKAETVEINEAYKPPQRSEDEMRAIQSEQRARAKAGELRREAQEKQLAEERAGKAERKAAQCAALDEYIEKLGSSRMVDGKLNVHYLTDEDGKSITAARQREIVAELEEKRQELGCP